MQELTGLSAEEAVAVGGVLGSMLSTILIVSTVIWVVMIIAHWRLFTKAGEPGWKSIIPIYNNYMLYKLVWDAKNFWIYVGTSILGSLFMSMSGGISYSNGVVTTSSGSPIFMGLGAILLLVGGVMSIIVTVKTAYAYGKGTGFAIGLVLFYGLFCLILAFGSAEYVGPNGNPKFDDPRA